MIGLLRQLRRQVARRVSGDGGFTLVEVIIAVSLLGLVTGAGTASLLTATSAARSSSQSARESSDAQLISAFLVKDAAAAGGTNPVTGVQDTTLGLFNVGLAGCTPAGDVFLADFRWIDRGVSPHTNSASYALDTTTHELSRRACRDGVSNGDLVLGTKISTVSVGCFPAGCPVLPEVVTFTITETNSPQYSATAFTYSLTAQFRPQSQEPPSPLNSGSVPLLALGGGSCPSSGAFLNVNGNAGLVVQLGGAVVNVAPTAPCKAMSISGSGSYSADSTSILSPGACSGAACPPFLSYATPLANPLATRAVPPNAGACAATSGNPPLVAGHYQPGVYKNAVTIGPGVTAIFDTGTYIFCNGLDIKGTVIAPNVLFYFAGGSLSVNASANITLGSQTSGTYADVSMWFGTAAAVTINGGAGIDSYKGIIYAPLAVVSITGGSNLQLGSVIAYAIDLGGNGFTTVGPGLTITTADLPPAFIGVAFTVTLTAAAGVAPYHNWTATGLPFGLSLNTATGVISGMPTTIGAYPVVVGVTDTSSPTNRTVTRPYTLNVGSGALTIASPATLFAATLNTNYSATIVASGGTGGYSWTTTGLPSGLLIGGLTGVISGTPTTTGTFPITVTVTDGAAFTVTKNYSLAVNDLPVFGLPLMLPASTVGAVYLASPSVSFGSAPFTWTASANLPAGLTVNAGSGLLTGTPTTAATTPNVVLTVTDRNGASANRAYTIVINPAPAITAPATLPGWAVGTAYPPTTLSATGGTGGYTWSWTAPALPPGLSLNAATGVISGTPTAAGTFGSILAKVTDSVGVSGTQTYSITITAALSINAPASLANRDVSSLYPNATATVTGGSGGLVWSSSTLPPGLAINPSSGVISGTPTTAGTYPAIVISVIDSNGVVATRSYSLTIHSALAFTGPGSLPTWVSGTAYPSQTATASGGNGVNTWTATGLPAGLSMSAGGVISGTPTTIGAFSAIQLTVADTTGGSVTVGPFSITILQPLAINTTGVPATGIVGTAFNGSLSATGGSGNFSWSATGLPAGVTLSPAGVLSGTPTANAAYSVSITLSDNGTGGVGGPPATKVVSAVITISQPLAWGPLPTPPGAWTAGFAYPTQAYTTSGGAAPITWVITGLPAGMTSVGGAISGTPTTAIATTVTVKATDSIGQTLTRTFPLTINPTLTLSQSSAPATAWTVGRAYPSVTYSTTGGTPAVTVTATGVPAGMTFTAGVLSGTPTTASPAATVTVTATDAGGGTAVRSFSLTINATPALGGALLVGDQSIGYSSGLSLTGGTGPITWAAPTKPVFLSISPSTGVLSGTPGSAGSFPVTVTVTDAAGATTSANVTLTVRPPTPISISLNNGTGTVKKIDQGDTIVVTYSQALGLASVCPGGALPLAGNGNVLVTVNNGAGAANDTITVTAASCTGVGGLHVGTIDLGSNAFVTATTTFGANGNGNDSTISWAANALTIKLGKQNVGVTAVVSVANTATYTPDSLMQSSAGVPVTGTASVTGSSPNFFF